MKGFLNNLVRVWNSYKFRFVPWMVFNISQKTSRVSYRTDAESIAKEDIIKKLESLFRIFEPYQCLRDDLKLYNHLHSCNQKILR